ncbi:MAG: putative phage tail assembly chaperone [Desulfovibrio desulfuricans]|nr:putative phage tail assembly chaperone [Desulfovibrio desulfuricans]
MKKTITLNVNGKPLHFDMTPEIYNKYINELTANKKVAPTQNMLMRAVHDDDKEALKDFVAMPGVIFDIASMLVEEYAPEISVTVGE